MVDAALLEILEQLTAEEQRALLAVAEYLHGRGISTEKPQHAAEVLLEELKSGEPHFLQPEDGLSEPRLAARRFMRENPELMRLLAQ